MALADSEGDDEEWVSWEIEKLVGRRQIRYGKGKPETEYLVRWKGFGPAYDEWYSVRLLQNAKDLVEDYDKENKTEPRSGRSRGH